MIDKDTPDRIYATSGQEWSPFAGEPAVEYIKASKVNALVQALEHYSNIPNQTSRSGNVIIWDGKIATKALNEYKGTK